MVRIIRSVKQKYRSNSHMDDAAEIMLSICKRLQITMTVTNIGTEK